ncbi:hypothetical protein AX15_001722 [Amanita polypyramis BW_CC]|nr:hypothetical protein AX15_001722 [Amanita polypyramis BW_CC]
MAHKWGSAFSPSTTRTTTANMLNDLPQELLLAIISDLRIPEIANLSYLSRAWNDFIAQNESVIFHAAAILNHDVPRLANTPLDLLDLYSHRALSGVSTWKDLCVRLTQIKKSWAGIMPSTITLHQYTGDSKVHRFKVDEKAELIIATTTHGGITVTDLAASKWYDAGTHNPDAGPVAIEEYSMLWALPRNHVRPYAHCEYDHGYLIFDRFGASKEVWRLAEYDRYYPQCPSSDETPSPSPTVIPRARPDARQKDASSLASERWLYTGESSESEDDDGEQGVLLLTHRKKGHFVPWALLRPPTSTRAFRFVYPILLVASFVSVYLYDVRTGVLVQEIRDIQHTEGVTPPPPPPPPILGELFYVEHSPHHIFVCGDNCLRIFSRQTGQRVYDISAIFGNYGPSRWTISTQREFRGRALTGGYVVNDPMDGWIKAGSALYRHELIREEDRRERFVDRLMAGTLI